MTSTGLPSSSSGGDLAPDLSQGSSIYAKAATELRIGLLIDILREDFNITNRVLLDALRDGFTRLNRKLGQGMAVCVAVPGSSTYPASSSSGCIPVFAVLELLDLYINGQPSVDTRQACFDVFDVRKQRVVTVQFLRSLRGMSDKNVSKQTSGGSFAMLKAVLDIFQMQEDLTTTLTKDQVVPLFDLDDGVLVEGFLEEILRQIAIREFGASREDLI